MDTDEDIVCPGAMFFVSAGRRYCIAATSLSAHNNRGHGTWMVLIQQPEERFPLSYVVHDSIGVPHRTAWHSCRWLLVISLLAGSLRAEEAADHFEAKVRPVRDSFCAKGEGT